MAIILVASAVKKDVVFSQGNDDGSYMAGTQTYLEISQIDVPSLQAPGKDAFASLPFFKNTPIEEDEVAKKMSLLTSKIQELNVKIMAQFDDMKSFITENKFSIEIIGEVATLKKFLDDVLERFTEQSLENFRAAYERKSPLNIAYTLMSMLAQKSTNPFLMAMDAEQNKRIATLDAWTKIIRTVMGDLLYLEFFASGLINDKDMFDGDRLIEQSEEINEFLKQFEFKFKDEGWLKFKKEFEQHLKDNYWLSNGFKAEEITKVLEKECPDHSFYVGVFNSRSDYEKDFYYHCADKDNFIEVRDVVDCNAFVYRSETARTTNDDGYKKVEEAVKSCGKIQNNQPGKSMKALMNEDVLKKVPSAGFVALIKSDKGIFVQWANSPGRSNGPGWKENLSLSGEGEVNIVVGLP
ncbi:hypothetical protein CAEBREN_09618 [Caenorhabditis brenneri]|uniref:Uncharacterized protein n=1 Tax=Caenorhabditis brenneri TaxID=135651 RepID=G0NXG7_CAEBE|nr:hypothetical protein CAEBREN_09618 [Caenorhabditis brenneri]